MENNNKPTNNFFSGFLLGALVGAAMVFLFGTKRGKKILKAISGKGLDNISNILEKADLTGELEEFDEDDEPTKEKKFPLRQVAVKETTEEKSPARNASASVAGGKGRRFFRGISRHVN